jgi:EAL domain-containing protein (putative c-di-GMP-specific phosphodiesterase class I)
LTENKQSVQGIIFEITEGLLLDSQDEVMDMILKIRDAGIEVALDDFGTGYSSLSYLRRFDIDYLKIDKSFVDNIATNADSLAVCEAIIVMAHKLGMKVIAEGVETNEQLNVLTDAGCDFGQGYLFSRPIPAVDFENFLMLRGPLHQAKNGVAEIV